MIHSRNWLGLLAAALLAGAPPASATVSVTPRTELPLLTNGDPGDVSIAVLDDGSFAIAGTEIIQLDDRHQAARFVVQFFTRAGVSQGEPVVVGGIGTPAIGGVGSLGDHYFVNWATTYRPPLYLIKAAFYDETGTREGAPFRWPATELVHLTNYHRSFRYAPGPLRRILDVSYHQVGSYPNHEPAYAPTLRLLSSSAQPLGPPFPIVSSKRYVEFPDFAVNGQGRVVAVSMQCPRRNPVLQACVNGAQIFDGTGRPRSPFLTAGIAQPSTDGERDAGGFKVGLSQSGQFLLSWSEDALGTPSLHARLYGRDGRPLQGALTLVPGSESSYPSSYDVKALSGDVFLLFWSIHSGDTNSYSSFLSAYGAATGSLEPPAEILQEEHFIGEPILAVNSAGQGVVVWKSQVGEGHYAGYWSRFSVTDAQSDRNGGSDEP